MNKLEYSFIRKEANNEIILFINTEPNWLEQELEINLTDKNELSIIVNNTEYLSQELNPLLLSSLENGITKTIFCDNKNNFLAQIEMNPLRPTDIKKIKP